MRHPQGRSGTDRRTVRPKQTETAQDPAEPASGGQTAATPPARFEDAVLVRQVQAGELHAFTELVRKYQDRVYNTCRRICGDSDDAADLTQDAFLKAYRAIELFRGKSAFYTWIFRIAVNLSISHRRKRQVRRTVSLDAPGRGNKGESAPARLLRDEHAADPSDALAASDDQDRVLAALQELEADYRVAIVLRDIEGFDYQEIADVLELPVGTIKSRIFRGRKALAEQLRRYRQHEGESS